MKRWLIVPFLGVVPLMAELDVKTIHHMVEKIKSKRTSTHHVDFSKTPSPFVFVVHREENSTKPKIVIPDRIVSFRLGAVVNDRAYINGKWLKVGDTIEGYKVDSVDNRSVVLKKGEETVHLFLQKQKKTSKILEINEG
ncbi:hypothetical protein [Nitratifractor sp.]